MREVRFDTDVIIPTVEALFPGPHKSRHAQLVFDTGAGMTQLDVKLLEYAGYSAANAIGTGRVTGATGAESVEGYIIELPKLIVFGVPVEKVSVLAYDFDNFPGIDGLLGFDVIKRFHLEIDRPKGVLKIHGPA